MIVFSAIVPHSPLLIPGVGKENLKKMSATIDALKSLEEALLAAKPDTIVVISPHGPTMPDAFSINLNASYKCTMEEFGDFSAKLDCRSDFMLIDHMQRRLRTSGIPFVMISDEKLDYGVVVPMIYLTPRLPKFMIVPVHPSLGAEDQLKFGHELKDEFLSTNKRVAILASSDLAHTLSKSAPGGFSPHGKKFDESIMELLEVKTPEGLIQLPKDVVAGAKSCGLPPIIVLSGVISGMDYKTEILSYEAPFGIGQMVANFRLA